MAWENGCYYLIAYQDEKEPVGIRHYRVDRMSGVRVLELPRRGRERLLISICPPTCASTSACTAAPNGA